MHLYSTWDIPSILHKQRTALKLKLFNFPVNILNGYVQLFCQAAFAKKFFAAAVYKFLVSTDIVISKLPSALHTATHYKSTTFPRNTAQS